MVMLLHHAWMAYSELFSAIALSSINYLIKRSHSLPPLQASRSNSVQRNSSLIVAVRHSNVPKTVPEWRHRHSGFGARPGLIWSTVSKFSFQERKSRSFSSRRARGTIGPLQSAGRKQWSFIWNCLKLGVFCTLLKRFQNLFFNLNWFNLNYG